MPISGHRLPVPGPLVQTVQDRLHGEVPTWTGGAAAAAYPGVREHPCAGDPVPSAERVHEFAGGRQLGFARMLVLKIANQADAYAAEVVLE